ncbi:NAD(P)H-hydrate dehydratase [bacterium]|nr:NAD(P)H-hydrate dehydratase [bacterium]
MQEFRMPVREQNSHKGTFGKVLNFCGSKNYIGAAYLSTKSSLKVGAGLSALASKKQIISSVSAMLPEAIYLTREEGLDKINEFSVVLIGCGLGQGISAKNLLKKVMKKTKGKPLIIDADGLNLLATITPSRPSPSREGVIITPHPLEASRLLDCPVEQVIENLEDSAKKLSKKYNCVTVLKTHRTIVCDTNLEIYVNQHGNSALAKAGSGDVLAGIIAGLLAQGTKPFEACKLGVYLHSRSGEIASEKLTEYSVLANDLIEFLPNAIKEL